MSGPTTKKPLDVCGAVVAIFIQNSQKTRIQNIRRVAAIAPSYKKRNFIQRHIENTATLKENCKGE
jgi:hypothetical protein